MKGRELLSYKNQTRGIPNDSSYDQLINHLSSMSWLIISTIFVYVCINKSMLSRELLSYMVSAYTFQNP
jgi:hypothetical protein